MPVLGASSAYQIFAGLAELTGGYLLFWRRTSLRGALPCYRPDSVKATKSDHVTGTP